MDFKINDILVPNKQTRSRFKLDKPSYKIVHVIPDTEWQSTLYGVINPNEEIVYGNELPMSFLYAEEFTVINRNFIVSEAENEPEEI